MAVKVSVYGHSDDLIEFEADNGKQEEFDIDFSAGGWTGLVESPDGQQALLYVDYRNNGTWTATLGRVDEDADFPDWEYRLYTDDKLANSYTVIALLTLAEGTTITSQSKDTEGVFTL